MAGIERPPDENLKKRMVPLAPFLEILECAVCLDLVKIPFKHCQQGHLFCDECADPLQSCPTCNSKFSTERQVCMKNLLESLPRMCRNGGNGCKEIIEPKSDNDHEQYCAYRTVICRYCDKKTPVNQLIGHLEHEHSDELLHKRTSSQTILLGFEKYGYWDLAYIFKDSLFWLRVADINTLELNLTLRGVHSKKPTEDYFQTLKFEMDSVGARVTLKASEDPESDFEEDKDDMSSANILKSSVKRCVNQDSSLVLGYEFFAKPKPV